MGLVFDVSAIKIDADGLCASQEQCVFETSCKMQINKNTTTRYVPQR